MLSMFRSLLVALLPAVICAIGQPHYECGEHGRFEYCIDDIPGCVVGCHCHPGYYFDVQSKICEPNSKLVQDYRRLYGDVAPTRSTEMFAGNLQYLAPTPTTVNSLDLHVENIARESDDLGDWLYNQFFKTIESQVINNTDNKTKEPARRSNGPGQDGKMSKKRTRNKKGLKRKVKKKSDLRRKLLRISEDDSLFDSDSSSRSSESSDDSSDTGSSSSGSSDSYSNEGSSFDRENNNKKCDDEDKEHKQLTFEHRKPKAPLPSFIFLPQMETPFFPPLGLPAPPLPMYPLVPVPPMMIPTGNHSCASSEPPTTTTTTTTTTKAPQPDNDHPSPPPPPPPPPPVDDVRLRNSKYMTRKRKYEASLRDPFAETVNGLPPNEITQIKTPKLSKGRHGQGKYRQSRLHPSLRKRMKQKELSHNVPLDTEDNSNAILDDDLETQQRLSEAYRREPNEPDVDFRYLTQLIHKMDNRTRQMIENQPVNHDITWRQKDNQFNNLNAIGSSQPTDSGNRLSFSRRNLAPPKEEAYYSKLGQQIADLIRKIDAGTVPIEEGASTTVVAPKLVYGAQYPVPGVYTPRSFWERSVRSLLSRYKPYVDDSSILKNREDSLFNLENKVETFASTVKTLSLNELENVVVSIDKTKSELQPSTENPKPTTTKSTTTGSFNVNLLLSQYGNYKTVNNFENYFSEPVPNLYTESFKNNAEILRNRLKDMKNFQSNLRRAEQNDWRKITDSKTVNSDVTQEPEPKGIKYSKSNVTEIANTEISNLQRIVSAKLSEVANSRNQLPKISWLTPNIANLIADSNVHRIADRVKVNPVSLKIPMNGSSRRHYHHNTAHHIENNNSYLRHKGLMPIIRVKPSGFLQPQPSYFHQGLEQHFYFFD